MADDVAITPGSGATIGADEISSVKYQRVKLIHGADGVNAGDVSSANGLPVQVVAALPAGTAAIGKLSANSGVDIGDVDVTSSALPTGASTSAKQDTIIGHLDGVEGLLGTIDADTGNISTKIDTLAGAVAGTEFQVDIVSSALPTGASTLAEQQSQTTHLATIAGDTTDIEAAVEIMDDWDESDRCKVNPIVGQAGVQGGSGTVSALTQRVVLATDVALPAGTNAIGKLAANSGVDIGDVDVTSLPAIPAGTNLIGYVGHGKTLKTKTGSASATFTIVAAVTSKKIKVYSLSLTTLATTSVTITFKDGAAGTAIGTYVLQAISGAHGGVVDNVAVPSQLFETTAATLLEMAFSAAQTVYYNLRYWDDDAT